MKSKGGRVEDIQIKMAGSASLANIYIYVNSETIVSHEHCDTHLQFPWGSSNTIRVNIRKPGAYSVNDSNLYARKEGGTWEKVYNNDKTSPFYISREYVAFGFEFDIMAGTDWPYSDVFWTEKQTRSISLVDTIDVCMGGGVINSYITIHVNGNPVVDITDCVRHTRYNWGQVNGPGLSAPTTVNILHQGAFDTCAKNFWGANLAESGKSSSVRSKATTAVRRLFLMGMLTSGLGSTSVDM